MGRLWPSDGKTRTESSLPVWALLILFAERRRRQRAPYIYVRDIGSVGTGPGQFVGAGGIGVGDAGNMARGHGLCF